MSAMPVMIFVLCAMAIAYRYYSAFLASRVAALDGTRETPAYQFNDGQNYHPTNRWVLFGHHFAAISGAGPLIGPVLAAQFGYLPSLLWLVIGVCLAGAVQDFIVLAASIRRGGKSLAQIAFFDIGKVAGTACTIAILFIIIIALAGLGKVVVKALGGESVKYPLGSRMIFAGAPPMRNASGIYIIPAGTRLTYNGGQSELIFNDPFQMKTSAELSADSPLPADAVRLVPGSSWGTFTIACTIPIALLVGLWMYKIRPGHVVEASLIGAALTLAATVVGGLIPGSPLEPYFNLKDTSVIAAMAIYGFIASVLPVWILLCPRDYLSSFLKIGTIALLVGGVLVANPKLEAPAVNSVFLGGGPTVPGHIFPFLFITIMCGAISGFHALVSSGTTPKMIKKETDARAIGYGAMLIEGLVGVCAVIAACALPVKDYYGMNVDLAAVPKWQDKILQVGGGGGPEHISMYETLTQESLRGRTGGAVTLAVGMAKIFDDATRRFVPAAEQAFQKMWKYWYHFAIMFEALFILTTIDTGTRIGRFLLQETMGKVLGGQWGRADFWPGAILSTAIIVFGWVFFIVNNSMDAIWPMFGVANQMLSVIALAIASAFLANSGLARYAWATTLPMAFVFITTSTGAVYQFIGRLDTVRTQLAKPAPDWTLTINNGVTATLLVAMQACAVIVIIAAAMRIWKATNGFHPEPGRGFEPALAGK
ncbi:MAG TPA: carbon starvation protein A [Tepidisphaeraceae bacterium]|nr:carbon starvation protein A [Tepidisphaeraceae bacterium]